MFALVDECRLLFTHSWFGLSSSIDTVQSVSHVVPSSLRCSAGVHAGVGALQRLYGGQRERAAAGPGPGRPQTQRHPLTLLPPAGLSLVTVPLPKTDTYAVH